MLGQASGGRRPTTLVLIVMAALMGPSVSAQSCDSFYLKDAERVEQLQERVALLEARLRELGHEVPIAGTNTRLPEVASQLIQSPPIQRGRGQLTTMSDQGNVEARFDYLVTMVLGRDMKAGAAQTFDGILRLANEAYERKGEGLRAIEEWVDRVYAQYETDTPLQQRSLRSDSGVKTEFDSWVESHFGTGNKGTLAIASIHWVCDLAGVPRNLPARLTESRNDLQPYWFLTQP